MSADNWAVCPNCKKRSDEELREQEIRVDSAYGEIPVADFDAMRAELEALRGTEPRMTFREDYEFWGAEDGIVKFSYRGGCSECKTAIKFAGERPIESPDA